MIRTLLPALALLGGCAVARPEIAAAPPSDSPTIRYEAGPCFGACPVFALTVTPEGALTFEGRRFVKATGTTTRTVPPAAVRRFAEALEAYRPEHGIDDYSGANCTSVATDMPSVDVTWTGAAGVQKLHFYHGCDMAANKPIGDALKAALDALPLDGLIR